jgi:superfamily I DNA and RNA helicase
LYDTHVEIEEKTEKDSSNINERHHIIPQQRKLIRSEKPRQEIVDIKAQIAELTSKIRSEGLI